MAEQGTMKYYKGDLGPVPYNKYRVYGPIFHKNEGRNMVVLVDSENTANRTSTSYARFLMSVKIGRLLSKSEHVDHINNNKSDDRIENLQILTHINNCRKSAKGRTLVTLICGFCNIEFSRERRQITSKNNKQFYCSRNCCYNAMRN